MSFKKLVPLLAVLFSLLVQPAWAVPDKQLPLGQFANLPVQYDGRIMPLERIAVMHYWAISGEDISPAKALSWMALTLFAPAESAGLPLIPVHDANVRLFLELDEKAADKLSFVALLSAFDRKSDAVRALMTLPESQLSTTQQELRNLYMRVVLYGELMRTFTPLLPLQLDISKTLGNQLRLPPGTNLTYLDLKPRQEAITNAVRALITRKGENLGTYTHDEKTLAALGYHVRLIEVAGAGNQALRLIPPSWVGSKSEWLSPWQVLMDGMGSPQTGLLMGYWKDLANAYIESAPKNWDDGLVKLHQEMDSEVKGTLGGFRLSLENAYGRIPVYMLLSLLYAGAVVALGVFVKTRQAAFRKAGVVLFTSAIGLHALSLLARMFIVMRPPVTNLYESVLGVSLVVSGFAALIYFRQSGASRLVSLLAGAVGAAFLLAISHAFLSPAKGFDPLVAVLDTNFWLSVHVVTITAGYGFCVLAAIIAHVALALGSRNESDLAEKTRTLVHRLAIAALFFTTTGTVLGGIWADQSWGRFWGWDPKENGALLIVLWLSWLLHAKISAHMSERFFLAGMCALNLVVALAWFGVNLLNIGLHSYGFIQGVASGLTIYCLVQSLLIAALVVHDRRKLHAS